jgi:hypothetical protein
MITTRGMLALTATLAAAGLLATATPVASQQSVSLVITRYESARVSPRNHVQAITGWYEQNPTFRPHPGKGRGRGRGGSYPPGWEKQLRRHEVVPVSLRTLYEPAPVALVRSLPKLPRGYEYAVIGNRMVVLERPSWVVLDVLVAL